MIEINNLTTIEIDKGLIKKIIERVLAGEGACPERSQRVNPDSSISVAFIGPGRMRKFNKTYRKKNAVTDVLSFPESKVRFEKFKIGPAEKMDGLGEIVVCLREVLKNARKQSGDFDTELKRVIIHGVLHLLGLDHEKSEQEAEIMQAKEKKYL